LLADVCHWLTNPALLRSLARDHERHVRLRRHAIEIRGTLCNNERQGEYAFKMAECSTCPFYNSEHYERRFGKINQIVDVKNNEPG
jgi:hypothetical protein